MSAKTCLILTVWLVGLFATSSIKVDTESSFFVDQYGRTVIYHGVNAVYKVFPFYPETSHYDSNNSLTDIDLYNLKHWGMKAIRLHVAWEGVEPQRGVYNYTYVQKLQEIVKSCNKYGIGVILDAHQDLYNKKFCGEGFPEWTADRNSFPAPLKIKIRYDDQGYPLRQDCLKLPFSTFYLTEDLMQFQEDFFTDKRGLMTHFVKMWELVASYMQDEPNLLGYELVNEPIGSNAYRSLWDTVAPGVSNNKYLLPAYKRLYRAIRAIDPKNLVFFEPSVIDALSQGFFETPGGQTELSRQVFSYHVYCPLVTPLGEPKSSEFCKIWDALEVASKEANIQKMKVGGFMTEYGALSDSPKSAEEITVLTGLMGTYFRSWTYWQFKYFQDITTMADPGTTESFYDTEGNLQERKVRALAGPYAYAICGTPLKEAHRDGVYSLKWFANRNCFNKKTEIFLSEDFYFDLGFTHSFSTNCKDCQLSLIKGESKSFYEISIPESAFNRTLSIQIQAVKKS